ncbi:MAG TPA: T6SS immunity protein Tdi1 domain-containing protein [Dongiaceae bacterium]|nr:T6SS immunity protein Tdi1 domain-containing protein [Dongiaceae bacterium]
MYDAFLKAFSCRKLLEPEGRNFRIPALTDNAYYRLIDEFGGCSFENGFYRVMNGTLVQKWNGYVGDAFPAERGRFLCFGFDWLGLIYALDVTRKAGDEYKMEVFDIGGGDIIKPPVTIERFHNKVLPDRNGEIASRSLFDAWLAQGNPAPRYSECIGYKRPLFLGGGSSINDMELIDMEVYWSLVGQMLVQIRGLPSGSVVKLQKPES